MKYARNLNFVVNSFSVASLECCPTVDQKMFRVHSDVVLLPHGTNAQALLVNSKHRFGPLDDSWDVTLELCCRRFKCVNITHFDFQSRSKVSAVFLHEP